MSARIHAVEAYAKSMMAQFRQANLQIAHDYSHADRVRHWALQIAAGEGYADRDVVEAAALLHDIGLAVVAQRREHAQAGADLAAGFLRQHHLFASYEVDAIAEAIRTHSSLTGGGTLGAMLRDADMLELFGAVGVLRACASQYLSPAYTDDLVKGRTWGWDADAFTNQIRAGNGIGDTVVDYLNFHLSCADNLHTATAKRLAAPLVAYLRAFVLQLESEILQGRSRPRTEELEDS